MRPFPFRFAPFPTRFPTRGFDATRGRGALELRHLRWPGGRRRPAVQRRPQGPCAVAVDHLGRRHKRRRDGRTG